eukprot:m.182317 g.182317  ORF g.182317 m.182317 type:complete len:70 (-) comp16640_c0_seq1:2012-2221(-)
MILMMFIFSSGQDTPEKTEPAKGHHSKTKSRLLKQYTKDATKGQRNVAEAPSRARVLAIAAKFESLSHA